MAHWHGFPPLSPSLIRSLAFRVIGVSLGLLIALGICEVLLRIIVAGGLIPADRGFGAFVKQVKTGQDLTFRTVRLYESGTIRKAAPSLFRRVADERIGWEPVPNARVGLIRINSGGFRGPEYPMQPRAGRHRIAMLGDSGVFGLALLESQTLPGSVEAQLNALGMSESFEVLNFGVPGYATDQEAARLEGKVLPYGPEVVVLCFCFNDAEISAATVLLGQGSWSLTYYLGLYWHFMQRSFTTFEQMRGLSADLTEHYLRLLHSIYFKRTMLLIRQMGDLLARRGIPMILVIEPELYGLHDLRAGYPYGPVHEALGALGSEMVTVLDPLPLLAAESANPEDFMVDPPYDAHKNPRANRIIARLVAEEVLKKLRLEPRRPPKLPHLWPPENPPP